MSFAHLDAAWTTATKSPTTKLVLVALADHADDSGKSFPSVGRLVARTELSRRAVIATLKRLESGGFIKVLRVTGNRSTYQISPCTSCTRAPDAPVKEVHQTRAPDAPPPVHVVHRTRARRAPKPSLNHQGNHQVTKDTPAESVIEPTLALVVEEQGKKGITAEDVFQAYPRKQSKSEALAAIESALKGPKGERVTLAFLLRKVEEFAKAYAESGRDPQFIPYCAKWIRGKKWNDPLPEPERKPKSTIQEQLKKPSQVHDTANRTATVCNEF